MGADQKAAQVKLKNAVAALKKMQARCKGMEERSKKAEKKAKELAVKEKKRKAEKAKKSEKQAKIDEKAAKAEKKTKEKARKVHRELLSKQYVKINQDWKEYPVVCTDEKMRAQYSQTSPPVNNPMLSVLNELMDGMKMPGRGAPNLAFPAQVAATNQRLKNFQDQKNIDDIAGCAGPRTWRMLMCKFPMSMALCHEARACVLALQILLYRWNPAGVKTGRYCKQTQVEISRFQRETQFNPMGGVTVFPSGITNELDMITLIRRNGIRDKRAEE